MIKKLIDLIIFDRLEFIFNLKYSILGFKDTGIRKPEFMRLNSFNPFNPSMKWKVGGGGLDFFGGNSLFFFCIKVEFEKFLALVGECKAVAEKETGRYNVFLRECIRIFK